MTGQAFAAAMLLALGLGAPAALEAQKNPHRQGLWGEIGNGPTRFRIGCSSCSGVTTSGGHGSILRIGGTLSHKVLLGVETFGFLDKAFGFDPDDTTLVAEHGSLMGVVLWYPWRAHFYVRGGAGLSAGDFTVASDSGPPVIASGAGVGLSFGLGFDVPISRKFALSAQLGAYITAIGDIVLPTRTVDDVIPTMYTMQFGLIFR